MRAVRSWGLVSALAAVSIALPAIAAGALPSGASAPALASANSATFTDSSGENPDAPDITTLVVSNNDAGVLSFRINVPNRPAFNRDMLILMFVDTDNNPQTGDPESLGADYVIQIFEGEAALFRWDGADFTRRAGDPSAATLIFTYQGGITVSITAAELGNTTRFGFAAIVISGIAFDPNTGDSDFTNAVSDVAPAAGSGFYNFTVQIAKPTLLVRKFGTSASRPRAGGTFTMRLTTARSDTGAVIQSGRVTCVGRVGSARLRVQTARVVNGAATCTWQIPPNASGKTFRGSVAVVFEGLRASRSISRKIR